MPSIEPSQLLALKVTQSALKDAGYEKGGLDRENTCVIFGVGTSGELRLQYELRAQLPQCIQNFNAMKTNLPSWTEDSYAGVLSNVITGRICNRFGFQGPNLVIDAACASSLAALDFAIRELQSERSNAAIVGGVDTAQDPFTYLGFSRTQAFSPSGKSLCFDKNADGIVISEGIVVFVLKRLKDAEADGDKIYAIIKGIGASSDGKALGLTAPLPKGQIRALERAYEEASFSPSTIGFLEAHATGTKVGDRAEMESIMEILRLESTAFRSCFIGSVKQILGHTKASAGLVGLMKSILALHHKVLPGQNCQEPLDEFQSNYCPVYLPKKAKPWFSHPEHPRRIGTSAFGFGGTNFHVVAEEYKTPIHQKVPVLGGMDWPCELLIFCAKSDEDLVEKIRFLDAKLEKFSSTISLKDMAYGCALQIEKEKHLPIRLAMTVVSFTECKKFLREILSHLEKGTKLNPHIQIQKNSNLCSGKIALLFPGQGSQYINMAEEMALYIPQMRNSIESASLLFQHEFPDLLHRIIFPPIYEEEEINYQKRLTNTSIAQPALAAISAGFIAILKLCGIEADMLCGHSYGEYSALYAASVWTREDYFQLSLKRGQVMQDASKNTRGKMLAIEANDDVLSRYLLDFPTINISNYNSYRQTVVSGPESEIELLIKNLREDNLRVQELPVDCAFHSPLMKKACIPLEEEIVRTNFYKPLLPVYSNVTGEKYPEDTKQMKKWLSQHLLSPVQFIDQIQNMYENGARIFLETGPKSILSHLTKNILKDKPSVILSLDPQRGKLRGFLDSLGTLLLQGVSFHYKALFAERNAKALYLENLTETKVVGDWLLDGASIWHKEEKRKKKTFFLEDSQSFSSTSREDVMLSYQKTMRKFLDLQKEMMKKFLGGKTVENLDFSGSLQSKLDVQEERECTILEESKQAQIHQEVANQEQSPLDTLGILLKIVSEETGYPPEMLGGGQDIEAELGIDSIKRMEVLSLLQKKRPEYREILQKDFDEFTRLKTLEKIAEKLESKQKNLIRYIVKEQVAPYPEEKEKLAKGLWLIIDDGEEISQIVSEKLKEANFSCEIFEKKDWDDEENFRLEAEKVARKKIAGILNLRTLSCISEPKNLEQWHFATKIYVKNFFSFLKKCLENLEKDSVVISGTRFNGLFGRKEKIGKALSCSSNAGLLKTLSKEYPSIRCKSVDFDDSLDHHQIAQCIIDEIFRGKEKEIGYPKGVRTSFHTVENSFSLASNYEINDNCVGLFTGGARGITAEIALELAQTGMTIILISRTSLTKDVDYRGMDDKEKLRQRLLEEKKGKDISPLEIETKLTEILRQKERQKNIERLEAAGAKVEYKVVDVRDEQKFSKLIQEIYEKHKRIDIVVHGAGIIDDKKFADKSESSFQKVFDTKVDGCFLLSKHLQPRTLKYFILFSSISGYYGNQGQCDYAAANDILNRFACHLHQKWEQTRVISINWGPWSKVGMAKELIERISRQKISAISPEIGRKFFMRELQNKRKDVEVILG